MKLIASLGAAALVATIAFDANAAPQTTTTTVRHDRNGTTTKTVVTRNTREARGGWRWRTNCKTWYHHGRKYRSCKRVRYRW